MLNNECVNIFVYVQDTHKFQQAGEKLDFLNEVWQGTWTQYMTGLVGEKLTDSCWKEEERQFIPVTETRRL